MGSKDRQDPELQHAVGLAVLQRSNELIPSVPRPPDSFETSRLRLRSPQMEDAPSIYSRYASDPEVTRYLPWRPHRDLGETQTFLSLLLDSVGKGGTCAWVIESRKDHKLMGLATMSLASAREGDLLSAEEERRQYYKVLIAYHLARSEWGQGYATEAARALVGWALGQPQILRIWTVVDVDNAASVRVLEKLGMVREGLLKRWSIHPNVNSEPRDFYCYALVK